MPTDFLKTLLTVAVSFLAGLLAEPLRLLITETMKRKQIRSALYRDAVSHYCDLIGIVYSTRNAEIDGSTSLAINRRYLLDNLFEHYDSTDPANLRRLREFRELKNYFSHLSRLRNIEFPSRLDYEQYMRDVLNVFDFYVRNGRHSRWKAYRSGGRRLLKHWRNKKATYSPEGFTELL